MIVGRRVNWVSSSYVDFLGDLSDLLVGCARGHRSASRPRTERWHLCTKQVASELKRHLLVVYIYIYVQKDTDSGIGLILCQRDTFPE